MSSSTAETSRDTGNEHIMSRLAVIASFAVGVALSPLAFIAPHAVAVMVGSVVIPSIIFLGVEEAKEKRRPVENRLRPIAGAAVIITGTLGAFCSLAT